MKKRYISIIIKILALTLAAAMFLSSCGKVEIQKKSDAEHRTTTTTTEAAVTQTDSAAETTVTTAGTETAETTVSSTKKKKKSKEKEKTETSTTTAKQTAAPTVTSPTAQQTTAAPTTTNPQTQAPATTTVSSSSPQTIIPETSATTKKRPAETVPAPSNPPSIEVTEDKPAEIETIHDEPSIQAPDTDPEPIRGKQLSVSNIIQYPELPTGCETTALTILLNFYGVYADKVDIARNYLPKQEFYWNNGTMYGADFRTTFAGDPEDENSYGCYAPCIVTAGNAYLSAYGSPLRAQDVSGQDLDTILANYIDNGNPVLIWITSADLHEPSYTTVWTTPSGEQVQWYSWEHCVVLTGYDYNNNLVYVSDPMVGNTEYNMDLLKLRYDQFGRQCVSIG